MTWVVDDNKVAPKKVEEIIMAFKNHKAPGSNGIQAEVQKYGGETRLEQIHRLMQDHNL